MAKRNYLQETLVILIDKGNINLISDVAVAAEFLEAAFQSALMNVEINLSAIKDERFIGEIKEVLDPIEKEIVPIKNKVSGAVKDKITQNTK